MEKYWQYVLATWSYFWRLRLISIFSVRIHISLVKLLFRHTYCRQCDIKLVLFCFDFFFSANVPSSKGNLRVFTATFCITTILLCILVPQLSSSQKFWEKYKLLFLHNILLWMFGILTWLRAKGLFSSTCLKAQKVTIIWNFPWKVFQTEAKRTPSINFFLLGNEWNGETNQPIFLCICSVSVVSSKMKIHYHKMYRGGESRFSPRRVQSNYEIKFNGFFYLLNF